MTRGQYQTTRLAPGRHRDAAHGVCAMELSSMLADEHFTDRPRNVCPVIAAFLRGYNDALSDPLRQELFGIAASVVGSRTRDGRVRRDRAAALHEHAIDVWSTRRWRLPYQPFFTPENAFGDLEAAGAYVGRRARRDHAVHQRTVAFVEALIARGSDGPAKPHRQGGPLPRLGAGVEPLADRGDERQPQP